MAEHVPAFDFTKVWTSSADFPTYEGSEEQVRADMQLQPDELKAYVNILRGKVNDLLDAIETVVAGAVPDNSITAAKLTSDSVITAKIVNANVTTAKLADLAVTAAKLAAAAVTYGKIDQGAVRTAELYDGAVTAAKIGTGQVTPAKIAPGAVTADKLSGILPANVGIMVGTDTPVAANPGTGEVLLPEGMVYLQYSAT